MTALLATVLAGPTQKSFAASAFSGETCLTVIASLKVKDCDGQDPIGNHCASDAQTVGLQQPFIDPITGHQAGYLEMRFSLKCQTYWGRAFSFVPNSQIHILVVDLTNQENNVNNSSYTGPAPEIYSNMFYGAKPTIEATLYLPDSTPVAFIKGG